MKASNEILNLVKVLDDYQESINFSCHYSYEEFVNDLKCPGWDWNGYYYEVQDECHEFVVLKWSWNQEVGEQVSNEEILVMIEEIKQSLTHSI